MVERERDLERGRAAFVETEWLRAYEALSKADSVAPLATADLVRLGPGQSP